MGTKATTSNVSRGKRQIEASSARGEARAEKDEAVLAEHVASTVATIAAMHARSQREVSPHVRRIAAVTAALGQPAFLVGVVALVVGWVALNLGAKLFGRPPLDPPPFAWLQGALALSSLLMTTIVLITQNRQARQTEQRARLELQINMLAEQKVTKLIELVEELRRDMPDVRNRVDRVADEMTEPVDTEAVISALDKTLEQPRPRQR